MSVTYGSESWIPIDILRLAPVEQSQALFCSGLLRHELVVVHGSSSVTANVPVGRAESEVDVVVRGSASYGV